MCTSHMWAPRAAGRTGQTFVCMFGPSCRCRWARPVLQVQTGTALYSVPLTPLWAQGLYVSLVVLTSSSDSSPVDVQCIRDVLLLVIKTNTIKRTTD